jgi:hypothetical protein
MYVSTAHSDEQLETTCKAADAAMRTIRDKGLV